MTEVSQNGWPASPNPADLGIVPVTVGGISIGDGIRGGKPWLFLGYVIEQVHRRVEPLRPGQCWGYKYRPITGGVELSNHASGTAVDVNASVHPLGKVGTFTVAQRDEIHRILAEAGGSVRWGGDYVGRVDEMHFEIAVTPTELGAHMLGLDYSSGRPRGSEVKRLGYDFVIRYCGQPGNKKNATKAEVDDMLAHGVAVALVFESTAGRASQGFSAGVADARAATAHQAALGIPASRPIYYAVDYDADPVAVEPYFKGLNSVAGPDSAYGSFRVVQRLRADGLTVDSWQTVAWSHGQLDAGRDVFQRLGYVTVDGIQCDANEAFTADFGQYPVASAPTSTSTEEEEMGIYYARGDTAIPDVGQPAYAIFYTEKGVERRWVSGDEGALLAKVRPGGGGKFEPPVIPQGMLNAIPKVVGSIDWDGNAVKDPYA